MEQHQLPTNSLGLAGFTFDQQQRQRSGSSSSSSPQGYPSYQTTGMMQPNFYDSTQDMMMGPSSSTHGSMMNHAQSTGMAVFPEYYDDLLLEDQLPSITEQGPSELGDYADFDRAIPQRVPSHTEPVSVNNAAYSPSLHQQFNALAMHSPSSASIPIASSPHNPSNIFPANNYSTSPAGSSPHSPHQHQHQHPHQHSPGSHSHSQFASQQQIAPIDIQALPADYHLLSPHSPYSPSSSFSSNAPSPAASASSDILDFRPGHPLNGTDPLSLDNNGGVRRAQSLRDATKSARRGIEKKSRDKKTAAYERLKKRLEDESHQSYGGRSQAEVFDGVESLLIHTMKDNKVLTVENKKLKDQLAALGVVTSSSNPPAAAEGTS